MSRWLPLRLRLSPAREVPDWRVTGASQCDPVPESVAPTRLRASWVLLVITMWIWAALSAPKWCGRPSWDPLGCCLEPAPARVSQAPQAGARTRARVRVAFSPSSRTMPCTINQHRPHRALKLRPPRRDEITPAAETTIAGLTIAEIRRHGVLGGLINQYEGAA